MIDANTAYERAMDLAEMASLAEKKGDHAEAQRLLEEALQQAISASDRLRDRRDVEPSRSLVFYSAANLAFERDDLALAERLTFEALSGAPPPNVNADLRVLLDEVRMCMNLRRDRLQLERGELNVGLEGDSVLRDYVAVDEFFRRVNAAKAIFSRTQDRLQGRAYDDRSTKSNSSSGSTKTFMSLTQPGSYRVTLRFGIQPQLDGMSDAQETIDEVLSCLETLQVGGQRALAVHMKDETYLRNFVGLSRKLAPDGKRVSTVALSTAGQGEPRVVLLRGEPTGKSSTTSPSSNASDGDVVESFTGRLDFAKDKARRNSEIGMTDLDGKNFVFAVPEGLMRDIVRPYYDDIVEVRASRKGKTLTLMDVSPIETYEDSES